MATIDEKQLAPYVRESIAYVRANNCRVMASELSDAMLDLWVTGYPIDLETAEDIPCPRSEAVSYIAWQVFAYVCRERFGVRLQPYERKARFSDMPKPFRHFVRILQYVYYTRVTTLKEVDFDIFDMREYWVNARRAWLIPVKSMIRGWWQAMCHPFADGDGDDSRDFDRVFARIVRCEGRRLSEQHEKRRKERQG